MLLLKKNIFYIFLFFYFIVGSYAAINTGISFDEYHEERNWKFHILLIENLTQYIFFGENLNIKFQEIYKSDYLGYGIGFQIISQPIQAFLSNIIVETQNINEYGAHLTAKHFVVFSFFFTSGIFLYLILKKIINNEFFCSLSTTLYLTYPYLFGQALFSPKDVPFMSIWLGCTFISFYIFEKLAEKKDINFINILFFSFSTAYLLSIRIAGILIFLQYLLSFIIFINSFKINLFDFFSKFYKKILIFIILSVLFTLILYPPFWLNPLLVFSAIQHMSQYFNDVCTNTLGSCLHPKNLPPTYIPIWLSVKLPTLIILGLILIPLTEKKIFSSSKKNIYFGTILGTSILIPLILIFKKVHLYDELRQIMFLVPLIFILGLVSLYTFSKNIFLIASFLTLSLFIFENIKINPYQYVWFNLPSRTIDLTKKFELEYQGISGREISKKISNLKTKNLCVLVNPLHTVKPYLKSEEFNCYAIWQAIDTNYERPFLAVQHVRNIKKGKSFKCETIYTSSFNLLFHKKDFITGKLLRCKK